MKTGIKTKVTEKEREKNNRKFVIGRKIYKKAT